MVFIIGGAYQGKLDFAKEEFNLKGTDICFCEENGHIDLSKKCIYNFEKYAKYMSQNNITDLPAFHNDQIIIMNEIFSGVVPIDKEIRKYREDAGRLGTAITRKADKVYRLFLGIAQELK